MVTRVEKKRRQVPNGGNKRRRERSGSYEMDLSKELHPISYYIDDREAMLDEVFKVVKGPKLRAMLTSELKDIDSDELKQLCLEQLEGMSKKRIKSVLAGQTLDESSATEDDDEDGSNENEEEEADIKELFQNFDQEGKQQ